METLSALFRVSDAGLALLALAAATLAGAVGLRARVRRRRPDEESSRAWRSVGTWWALFGALLLVLVTGRVGALVFIAGASVVLLHETLRLVGRPRLLPAFVAVAAIFYAAAWLEPGTVFDRVLPGVVVVIVAVELALRLGLRAVVSDPPRLPYPALVAWIGPSYALALASLRPPALAPANEMGWFLLLVFLTELNDMAQSWWGRALGSRPLAPVLSPKKTWEGFLGGLATTTAAAVVVCPMLTSWGQAHPPGLDLPLPPWVWSLAMGLMIGLAGVAGDLSASALKRKAGVKDSGTLLPGHGGLLDRLDSLAATAPLFYAVTVVLWHPGAGA